MSTKTWNAPAFGSQSIRFHVNGLHPNLLNTGRMPYDMKSSNIGPGSYEVLKYNEFSEANVLRNSEGPNWEKSYLSEKTSKMPHLLYIEEFKNKIEQKKKLGPGYYEILKEEDKPHSKVGLLGAFSERFSKNELNNNPGPGTYGIPDEVIENKRKNKPGKVQLLERSKGARSLPMVGSEVPPGVYNQKNSIDELLKKKVSNRGPYDLFSNPNRSGPIKTGHYIQDLDHKLGPGQYNLNSFLNELNDSAHYKQGKFGKMAQYPTVNGDRLSVAMSSSLQPRNPDWPGPGAYNPGELSKFKRNLPSFLSTSSRNDRSSIKKFNNNHNSVGVGRYDLQKYNETEKVNGHNSIFVSKTAQITDQKRQLLLQERLKPCNLSNQEKINLHFTGKVNSA